MDELVIGAALALMAVFLLLTVLNGGEQKRDYRLITRYNDEWSHWSINKKPLPRNAVYQFTARWCGVCREIKPMVVKLQRAGYPIYFVDADECPNLATKMQVGILPTSVLMVNGRIAGGKSGRVTERELLSLAKIAVKHATKSNPESGDPR